MTEKTFAHSANFPGKSSTPDQNICRGGIMYLFFQAWQKIQFISYFLNWSEVPLSQLCPFVFH